MKQKPPKESEILAQVMDVLRIKGAKAIRVNSGGRPWTDAQGRKRYMRFNDSRGCSDILACYRGRFLAIEVKRPRARTDRKRKAEQEAFLSDVAKAGGIGAVVESIDDVTALLRYLA